MKIYQYITAGLTLLIGSYGCKKDYLNLQPKDQLVVSTTFADYKGFQTYAWQFYNVFPAYNGSLTNSEFDDDLFLNAVPNGRSNVIWQLLTIPATDDNYTNGYANLRAINIMMDNIDQSKLSDNDKKHWRAVGAFFRAYNYAELLNRFGSVPLVLRELKDTSSAELYKPRSSRDSVAAQIMEDLKYAEENINAASDGPNTINANVVRALISRFGLREGTWRKYHGLSGAETYLQASSTASEALMQTFPSILPDYDMVFNSESLIGAAGIILCKQYVQNQITHGMSTSNRNSSGRWDLTKKAVDLYLMTDGQSRFTSPLFTNDKTPNEEFKNRDKRLYYTVPPPYRVITNAPSLEFTYTTNPEDTLYFDLMRRISTARNKALPVRNWNGFVVRQEPHFVDFPNGQPYCVTYTGYRFYKFYNQYVNDLQGQDINDAPVFRIEEVWLNYAESQYELGKINQDIIDKTINQLRKRGGVAPLQISNIVADPSRDPGVAPVLWEIRRERAVELMGEGFRYNDLRRWKKMDYVTARKLGRWIKKGADGLPANVSIPIQNGATEGYIDYEGQPPASFPDYYYLYPLPSNEIVLNPLLTQNPGWK
ncbi:hypothetical protein A8C56_06155 [Niabella ginsenosidivorans]|uniref:Carbohydrate-binding protein SusD n=1 Tax=Niabella ginsenosidivorans TaxID=1176587 RepID=A0A1A9I1M3_9BACT|nr:RagB/SusD family nutrient uptake outer membrane protein [Niabella ginsenosidivorans]ANH80620.1 hypothetical protein A8C56_06155 [Niabella ginsenosidivorans]